MGVAAPLARLWAHIYLHERHVNFDIVQMLIGRKGINAKGLNSRTDAKLHIRGRRSGHLEVDGRKEAPVPLMGAVTANKMDPESFRKAVEMILKCLQKVGSKFCMFSEQRGFPQPTMAAFRASR